MASPVVPLNPDTQYSTHLQIHIASFTKNSKLPIKISKFFTVCKGADHMFPLCPFVSGNPNKLPLITEDQELFQACDLTHSTSTPPAQINLGLSLVWCTLNHSSPLTPLYPNCHPGVNTANTVSQSYYTKPMKTISWIPPEKIHHYLLRRPQTSNEIPSSLEDIQQF